MPADTIGGNTFISSLHGRNIYIKKKVFNDFDAMVG